MNNLLEQIKTKVIHCLQDDEHVLREYNVIHERIQNECAYNGEVLHALDDAEVADKVGRCFKLQGFDVRIIIDPSVRPVLIISGWDCEL